LWGKREFAFRGKTKEGEEYFTRYRTFINEVDFAAFVGRYGVERLEIGPVYLKEPRVKGDNEPIKKELVFDIDMDKYDDVRSCCSGANVCNKCWNYVRAAMKVVTLILEEWFGFTRFFWVFSGRRGVHCWVWDEEAKCMSSALRQSVVDFISKPAAFTPMHKKCVEILREYFVDHILPDMDVFNNEKTRFPSSVSDIHLPPNKSSVEIWNGNISVPAKIQILFHYMWPRLDSEVTVGLNHLLKSPFSIHPQTGKVSVPIPVHAIDAFDPITSPPHLSNLHGLFFFIDALSEAFKEKRKF
jgi:DNA primase small subunit